MSKTTIQALKDRVIATSVVDKFEELIVSSQSPLCLFPTRKLCQDFNTQMLSRLHGEIKDIPCVDEVDETLGKYKWNQKASDALKKLNSDCNMTIHTVFTNKLGCMPSVNIWEVCVDYDELTINERQKQDQTFSLMLDEVRRGCVSKTTIQALKDRVIATSVVDKFEELMVSSQSPLCLFPTRKLCQDFNTQMLSRLHGEIKDIPCVDEVDETLGKYKWNQKASDALKKLNSDCNMTARLEAVIVVQFDGKHDPHPVERVKSKFMLLQKLYVHRKQFPLILAFGRFQSIFVIMDADQVALMLLLNPKTIGSVHLPMQSLAQNLSIIDCIASLLII